MRALKPILLSILLIGMFVAVTVALAGNVHFNSPNFSLGSGLAIEGELVALETEEFEVSLTANGAVTAICEDRAGNHVYGQSPIPVEVSEVIVVTGRPNRPTLIEVHAPDPTSPEYEPNPTPEEAGCPEGNWSVSDILDGSTDWTSARLVFTDSDGVIQAEMSFACTTLFKNSVGVRVDCEKV